MIDQYNLAFQFRQSKLWRKLQPTDVFAVRLSGGALLPCHVEGRLSDEIALVAGGDRLLFVGKEELSPAELSAIKQAARKHKLKLKDDEMYPRFEGGTNWTEVLEAVLFLSAQLSKSNKAQLGFGRPGEVPLLEKCDGGFSIGTIPNEDLENTAPTTPPVEDIAITGDVCAQNSWPEPSEVPDRLIRRLRSFPRKRVLQFDIVLLGDIDSEQDWTYIISPVDKESGLNLDIWSYKGNPFNPNTVLAQLIDVLIESGYYPKKIEVRTEEVECLLRAFCQKANIQLRRIKALPELDRVFDTFYDKLMEKLEEDTTCTDEQ